MVAAAAIVVALAGKYKADDGTFGLAFFFDAIDASKFTFLSVLDEDIRLSIENGFGHFVDLVVLRSVECALSMAVSSIVWD